MAIRVCYSKSAPADHGRIDAIYLDQAFYETIFERCRGRARACFPVLGVIASLRYKSPLIVVTPEELDPLSYELSALEREGCTHPQIPAFRQVCAKAQADGVSLSVSGDMHPER